MSDEAIEGIRVGLQLNRQVDVTDRNVIWQEIVAALNRRGCVSNFRAGKLVEEGWSESGGLPEKVMQIPGVVRPEEDEYFTGEDHGD